MFHLVVSLPDAKFGVTSHPTPEGRDAAAEKEEQRHFKVDQASDLEVFSQIDLFDLYNFLAVKPISTMKPKPFFVERVWALLDHKAAPGEAFVKPADDAGTLVNNSDQRAGAADAPPANQEGQMANNNEGTTKKKAKRTAKPKAKVAKVAKPAKAAKTTKVAKTTSEKKPRANAKAGKPAKPVGDLRQVRAGTIRAKILKLSDGTKTVQAIAQACGITEQNLISHAYCLNRDCGLGYKIKDSKLEILYPGQKTIDDVIKASAK